MTRIVYWNVEKFSSSKLAAIERVEPDNKKSSKFNKVVTARRDLIRRHFLAEDKGTGAGADIVVIAAVSSDGTGQNQMISRTGGWNGLRKLLGYLRATDPTSGWNLVPPFSLGLNSNTEGVGIFYKSIIAGDGGASGARYFTGPNKFNPGTNLTFDPEVAGAPAAGDYAAPGMGNSNIKFFGTERKIPTGAGYNPSKGTTTSAEQQCAPRVEFDSMSTPETNVDWGDLRQPFMATFYEEPPSGGGAARDLTLFAVHSPAKEQDAKDHVKLFADCEPIANKNKTSETRIVLGNFNINLFDDGAQTDGYDPLIAGKLPGGDYALQISVNAKVSQVQDVYQGYYATHIKGGVDARFKSTKDTTLYYPGFGYISDGVYSIDNVLVRAPGGGAGDAKTSILNSVVGAPMTDPAWCRPVPPAEPSDPPPMAVEDGVVKWTSSMATVPEGGKNPDNAAPEGTWSQGLSWKDYGHIRSASDHLALVTVL